MSARTYAALALIVTLISFIGAVFVFCDVAGITFLTYVTATVATWLYTMIGFGLAYWLACKSKTASITGQYEVTQ